LARTKTRFEGNLFEVGFCFWSFAFEFWIIGLFDFWEFVSVLLNIDLWFGFD